jgi:hypothetical protein
MGDDLRDLDRSALEKQPRPQGIARVRDGGSGDVSTRLNESPADAGGL